MAFFEMHYHSDALGVGVSVNVVLPEKAKTMIGMTSERTESYKTLYLFHGLSDDHTIWMRRTSIERYASELGIAVVMPAVGRSWYTDKPNGERYLTFVTRELPDVCRSFFRGMSEKREDTMVAGLSMGGYGAVKAALTAPERFGGCAALSGAFDLVGACRRRGWKEEMLLLFGVSDAEELRDSCHDVYALARAHRDAGKEFPRLYLWCGEQDYLLEDSRRLHALFGELGVEHTYEESEGDHSWKWWDLQIQSALKVLLGK